MSEFDKDIIFVSSKVYKAFTESLEEFLPNIPMLSEEHEVIEDRQ
jgi:hypothetical protein